MTRRFVPHQQRHPEARILGGDGSQWLADIQQENDEVRSNQFDPRFARNRKGLGQFDGGFGSSKRVDPYAPSSQFRLWHCAVAAGALIALLLGVFL